MSPGVTKLLIAVRIRNILAEYPVTNLIKELLQNADDARATRVKVTKNSTARDCVLISVSAHH